VEKRSDVRYLGCISYTVGTAFSWLGGYVLRRVAQETEMRCEALFCSEDKRGLAVAPWTWGMRDDLAVYLLLTELTVAAVMSAAGWARRAKRAATMTLLRFVRACSTAGGFKPPAASAQAGIGRKRDDERERD